MLPVTNALAAGAFSSWLDEIQAALRGEAEADVPCGPCTACCRSSQFIHIEPDETDTLAAIPAALVFPAPRLPMGHVVLGYDDDGCCPMLGDAGCSIYEYRPRTCRTYDCRIFAATGIEPDGEQQPAIAERVGRWRFDFAAERDHVLYAAVQAAADHVARRTDGGASATEQAVVAIRTHQQFLPPSSQAAAQH